MRTSLAQQVNIFVASQQKVQSPNRTRITSPEQPNSLMQILRTGLVNLAAMPHRDLQFYVRSKEGSLRNKAGVDLSNIDNELDLKYLIMHILEIQLTDYKYSLPKEQKRVIINDYIMPKIKRTNIAIDLDFTQFFAKIDDQSKSKQKTIEMLQDMMIDKDNEIEILEEQNQELKRQIQEVMLAKNNQKVVIEEQSQKLKKQRENIGVKNNQLQEELKALACQVDQLKKDNESPADQFLRRCLFIQATSIENFLYSKTTKA